MELLREACGATPEGDPIERFVLRAPDGLEAQVLSYGAILASLCAPDRHGEPGQVVLGFERLTPYLGAHPHFGATVGRYANRIAGAAFALDGRRYQLLANEGPNQLHGGPVGFDRASWRGEALGDSDGCGVRLRHTSPEGDQGFPGRLEAEVTYRLTPEGALRIDYEAQTDRPTVVNLTNHSYFNLRDGGAGDVRSHVLWIDADRFTPTREDGIPTGAFAPVADTPLDFREPRYIGARLAELHDRRGGYDHSYARNAGGDALAEVARLHDPESGRRMRVLTTQPGVQLYTGNLLDGSLRGHGGRCYGRWSGVCLETQHFPDSPNQPDFPSTVLRPGARYRQTTIYAFETD